MAIVIVSFIMPLMTDLNPLHFLLPKIGQIFHKYGDWHVVWQNVGILQPDHLIQHRIGEEQLIWRYVRHNLEGRLGCKLKNKLINS
jgi:hypothetical protein